MGDTTPAPSSLHVLIVGAGCTGLLIAHGLKKAGIKYSCFEAEPSASYYRPREWTMGLHWGIPMMKSLLPPELVDRLKDAQGNPHYTPPENEVMKLYDGEKGGVIKEVPMPGIVRYSRRKLRSLLAEGINITYDAKFASVTETPDGIEASFQNGTKVSGSVIVGTDGPQSAVRMSLLGEAGKAERLSIIHTNVNFCFKDAAKAKTILDVHQSFVSAIHPTGLCFLAVQDAPEADKIEDWSFSIINTWLGERDSTMDNATRVASIKDFASKFVDPFKSATTWLPDDVECPFEVLSYWVPVPRDNQNGTITLAGDAAHPMTPHRGQGMNHAINSAKNFVLALEMVQAGAKSLKEAVDEYDTEVIARGGAEVTASLNNTLMFMKYDNFKKADVFVKGIARTEATEMKP